MAEQTAEQILANEQADKMSGALGTAANLAQTLGVHSLAGMAGIGEILRGHGMDAAADAVDQFNRDHTPELGPSGQTFVRNTLAPVAEAARKVAPYVAGISPAITAMQAYNKAVPMAADMAGRVRPELGGAVGALGEAAQYAGFPESGAESGAGRDAYELLSKYGTSPVLSDGTTARTLARENAANSRRYAEGLRAPEVPPSEFVGRQAEHEGAVATRMKEPPAYVKAKIPSSYLDPSLHPQSFTPPDGATSYVAMDPQTGEQLAHVTFVQRGDGVQAIRQDTKPGYQGQGIGSDLLSDAISDAHGKGLDFHSDTQLSVPAARAYEKVPGAVRNEDVTHLIDPSDGDVGVSNNGRPVYSVPKQVPADEAEVGEMPHFNPNSYIGSQAYAEGGEIGVGLEDVAGLLKKYADLPKKTVTEDPSESIHNMNMFMQGAHPSMLDPGGWPKTFYHGTPVFTTKSGTQIGDVQQFDPMAVVNSKITRGTTYASGNKSIRSPGKLGVGKFDSFGSWFSDNPSIKGAGMFAGDDGAIYPVYLNLKNPYQPKSWDEFYNQYNQVSPSLPKNPQKMKEWLTGNGYDGILFPRSSYDGGDHSMAVALEPTQIKSAIGNVGTYDQTNPDITMAKGGAVADDIAALIAKYAPKELEGAPRVAAVGDVPVPVGPNQQARQAAANYMKEAGIRSTPQMTYAKADPARGKAIAAAFDAMEHNPSDPAVKASYDAMIKETLAQYQHMKAAGVNVEFMPPGVDPYAASPRLMMKDLAENNHMYVYPTNAGFGSGEDVTGNPLLGDSGEKFGGVRASAPSYSDAEDAIRDAGYAGYHTPDGAGLFRGQGRLFVPTPATRISAKEARLEDVGSKLPDAANSASPRTSPVSQIYDDTGDTGDFARGGPVRLADGGGELGVGLEDIGNLIAKYSIPASDKNAQAAHLLGAVADNGSVTYNPTSGDIHQSGYAVPHEINRSVSSDTPFTADDVHDFLVSNQDAFENPKAALHIESDDDGNHFMHVAHVEPDYEGAVAAATASGAPGIRELHSGRNLPTAASSDLLQDSATDPDPAVNEYLAGTKIRPADLPASLDTARNERPRTAWQHGKPTVDPAQRVAFPGIYNDPRQVIADANSMVGPEDPLLQRLFGVSRQDLSEIALSRQGNEIGTLPGAKQNATGAASARAVMTPQNEQRLIDVLTEARGTPLYTGMTGWYSMDPL